MNKISIALGLIVTIALWGCSSQKAVTTEAVEDTSKVFNVQLIKLPCTTVLVPEEEEGFEEPVPKPYAKGTVYIAQRDKKGDFVSQQVLKLDAEGSITVDLDTVMHYFSPDPLILEREQGDTTPLSAKQLCELEWTRMHAALVTVTRDKSEYDVLMAKECSICGEIGEE